MVESLQPIPRFAPGGMAAVSPAGKLRRRRREDEREHEPGRNDGHAPERGDDEDGDDDRPHVDVLA